MLSPPSHASTHARCGARLTSCAQRRPTHQSPEHPERNKTPLSHCSPLHPFLSPLPHHNIPTHPHTHIHTYTHTHLNPQYHPPNLSPPHITPHPIASILLPPVPASHTKCFTPHCIDRQPFISDPSGATIQNELKASETRVMKAAESRSPMCYHMERSD